MMLRLRSPLIIALIVSGAAAIWSGPATSHQLPIPGGIPGVSSSVLSEAETFFSQAVAKASPATMQKINELVGRFQIRRAERPSHRRNLAAGRATHDRIFRGS